LYVVNIGPGWQGQCSSNGNPDGCGRLPEGAIAVSVLLCTHVQSFRLNRVPGAQGNDCVPSINLYCETGSFFNKHSTAK